MNTIKTAMTKVANINKDKTELNTHRLNLNLQADIAKVTDEIGDSFGALEDFEAKLDNAAVKVRNARNDFDDLVNDVEADIQAAKSDIQQAQSIVQKVEQAAKDLGVEPDSVKGYDFLIDEIQNLEEQIKFMPKFIQQLR